MTNAELLDLLREIATHHQHNGACTTDGYNPPFDGDHCLRCRIEDAIASLTLLTEAMGTEYSLPKCEHGIEYGGIGVGCCLQCDNKALVLASNEPPKAKA